MSSVIDLDDAIVEICHKLANKLGVSPSTVLAMAILLLATKMKIPEGS